uniref:Transposase n=1 Tax=Acrobeloides nanus TaxID=290746 RepID=A0A914DF61_9BILA
MKLPYTTVRDTVRRYREKGNYNDGPRNIFPECIEVDISPKRNNGEWPPNSPELCVEDFSFWSILENEACSKPHQSIEALKKSLVKAWNAIPQEVIDRAVDDFPKRLKKCIDAQGSH